MHLLRHRRTHKHTHLYTERPAERWQSKTWWALMMWIFSDLCSVHEWCVCVCVCVCLRLCHGSMMAFMCWKSSKEDCTSCDTHTHSLQSAIIPLQHASGGEAKCVCVCDWMPKHWLKEESEWYMVQGNDAHLVSSLMPPFPPRRSFLVIHTSQCASIYYYYNENLSSHLITL